MLKIYAHLHFMETTSAHQKGVIDNNIITVSLKSKFTTNLLVFECFGM